MTLRDFIARMQTGWGFARPGTPKRIGCALAALYKESPELDAKIDVNHRVQHNTSGSTSYIWDVTGVAPRSATLAPGETEVIFGAQDLPSIVPMPGGVRIIYVR